MDRRKFLTLSSTGVLAMGVGYALWGKGADIPFQEQVSEKEKLRTLEAMRPPKRERPVIAVLADNQGSETTDFIVPWSVLKRSGVADVYSVAMTSGPIQLMPALRVMPDMTIAQFRNKFPAGADYLIVPALHDQESPAAINWIKEQSTIGATTVGICAGALTLAHSGVLDGKRATTHWFNINDLAKISPSIKTQRSRRFVADAAVITTTGVSASLPLSLKLVEAIAGKDIAKKLANELGVREFSQDHPSEEYRASVDHFLRFASNAASIMSREDLGLLIEGGADELSVAFVADAWSRTYKSKCYAVADGMEIVTKNGMIIIPDWPISAVDHSEMLPKLSDIPGESLNSSLSDIAARYDQGTAALVALQLEHPWP